MPAELEDDAPRFQLGSRRNLAARFRQRDAGAAIDQQFGGGDTAPRCTSDRDPLPCYRELRQSPPPPFALYRSFNVVRLARAHRMAAITKRVITLGSLQPISSK